MGEFSAGATRGAAQPSTNPFGIILKEVNSSMSRRRAEDLAREKENSKLTNALNQLGMKHEFDKTLEEEKQKGRLEIQKEKSLIPKPFKAITREDQLQFEADKAKVTTEALVERSERKTSASVDKQRKSIRSARNVIGQLKSRLDKIPSTTGIAARTSGIGRGILGKIGLDPKVSTFNNLRKSVLGQMAKIVSGESGRLTDQDITRIEAAIPRVTDTTEERSLAFQALEDILGESESIFGGGDVGGKKEDFSNMSDEELRAIVGGK